MFFDLAVERLYYTVAHVSTFVYHAYSRIAGRKLHIRQHILHISPQCLTDAPCLRIAASWIVRCIPVENFGDRADTAIVGQMMTHRPEQGKQLFGTFQRMVGDFCVSGQKTAEQKSPCRTLVVSCITLWQGTTVNAVIVRMVTGERAKSAAYIKIFLTNATIFASCSFDNMVKGSDTA